MLCIGSFSDGRCENVFRIFLSWGLSPKPVSSSSLTYRGLFSKLTCFLADNLSMIDSRDDCFSSSTSEASLVNSAFSEILVSSFLKIAHLRFMIYEYSFLSDMFSCFMSKVCLLNLDFLPCFDEMCS